jgi:alanyl-tRNA synthetase
MMTGRDIRKAFLDFFASKGHTIVKSAGLIPQNDPTLYFTNAGMVPFKNIFTGEEKRDYIRATTSQKCMRVSGKHNDLENVGRTARHHTFFEMLGNFSFGDYFKKDAIGFAWEFLTKVVGIDKDKLWITVFEKDDEAEALWQSVAGVPIERIFRLGEKDNFWSMGETGPCGPCSEIHYQFDDCPAFGDKPTKEWFVENSDAGRIMEIWNLVFMQFERSSGGSMTPLPKPSIDTGMGLERLAAVLQGKTSNYDSDLFTPLFIAIEKIVGKKYGRTDAESDVSMRVLADHIRAAVFLISDGVLPSNEGRGYVLRRILRRAIRHGKLLGQEAPFFYRLVDTLIAEMASAYPDLTGNQNTIERVIKSEEERFFETLGKGLKILAEEVDKVLSSTPPSPLFTKEREPRSLSGDVAFKLYDTFGFPLDLTEIICAEQGLTVDQAGFDAAMTQQKVRARANWKGSGEVKLGDVYFSLAEQIETAFLGYGTLEAPAIVKALIQNGQSVSLVSAGDFEAIFDCTPFYGEGGGQAGDKGLILSPSGEFMAQVTGTQKPLPTLFVHQAQLKASSLKVGDAVQLKVARDVRLPIMRNHTATHIMHAALRKILGEHVRQAGSLVNDKLLRFDFSHFEGITPEDLKKIEEAVNQVIFDDLVIHKAEMSYDQAVANGALAFFGDKYGDLVRVVSVGDYSVELCGGTHLDRASQIGCFKIISEGSVAAGVRRIEAVTGLEAVKQAQEESGYLQEIAALLKSTVKELPQKIDRLQSQVKSLDKEIEKLKAQALRGGTVDFLKEAFEVGGVKAVVYQANVSDAKALGQVADALMEKLVSGVSVVTTVIDDKASLIVSVSQDLTARFQAGKLVSAFAELVGGRGGGKPDRAQAGGPNVDGLGKIKDKLSDALH